MRKMICFVLLLLLQSPLVSAQSGPISSTAEVKTLVVDQNSNTNFNTIAAAMETAHSGDIVQVNSGTYREPLILKDGVTLQGKGMVQLESNKPLKLIKVKNVKIQDLTIVGGNNAGIQISNGKFITISKCNFINQLNQGITITDSREILISNCNFNGLKKGKGIVSENSQLKIIDCMISQYQQGVVFSQGSKAKLIKNLLDVNEQGLFVIDSQVTAKKNLIMGTGKLAGITLKNTEGVIEGNSIRHYRYGFNVIQSTGEFARNVVSQNGVGISVANGSINISENVIINNTSNGIQILGTTSSLDPTKVTTLLRNTITDNRSLGIAISNAKAVIRNNLVEGNMEGLILNRSDAEIQNNTVVLHKGTGIRVSPDSWAIINNNIVAFNTIGIRASRTSKLKMSYNNVFENYATKSFPLRDANYFRDDILKTRDGELIHIGVYPAYDLKTDTDLSVDPKFVALGSNYSLQADSPMAKKKGNENLFIGAFPPIKK